MVVAARQLASAPITGAHAFGKVLQGPNMTSTAADETPASGPPSPSGVP